MITEMQRTNEEVYTRKDEQGVPKEVCMSSGWSCNMHGMTLTCLDGMA